MKDRPKIFEYEDYRRFLKECFAWAKVKNAKFSHRYFARAAGFQSPSFLKHVMEGERNLSPESIDKVAQALKLNKEESSFFKSLVMFNQASLAEEKQVYFQEILKSKTYRQMYPLKEFQVEVLSHWYFIPIRELVGMPGFSEDPAWISKTLRPPISAEKAKEAIESLIKAGLLTRDLTGKLMQANRFVAVPDEITFASLAHCHKELIKKSGESIDTIPRDQREIGAVTLRISVEKVKIIKEMIQNFRNNILEVASGDDKPDAVYQWNFQLFPVAVVQEDEK